jgi:hypothetical protein
VKLAPEVLTTARMRGERLHPEHLERTAPYKVHGERALYRRRS